MMSRRLKSGGISEKIYLLMRKTRWVAVLVVFVGCVASGPTLAEVDTSIDEDEFWNRLYVGDSAGAEQFLRPGPRHRRPRGCIAFDFWSAGEGQ